MPLLCDIIKQSINQEWIRKNKDVWGTYLINFLLLISNVCVSMMGLFIYLYSTIVTRCRAETLRVVCASVVMLRCSLMFLMLLSDTGATLISDGQRLRGGVRAGQILAKLLFITVTAMPGLLAWPLSPCQTLWQCNKRHVSPGVDIIIIWPAFILNFSIPLHSPCYLALVSKSVVKECWLQIMRWWNKFV